MVQATALTRVRPGLTPSEQSTSRLLQIPAEIRLIILRQLLTCDKPIYSLSSTDDIEYLESIQRSAQLLRTCQLIHKEGVAILYTENTLCIDFMDFDPDSEEETVHFCGIFEMYLPMPEKLTGSEDELLSLIEYATPARATSSDETGLMRQSAETLRKQWSTLQKFSRYQIRIQYATQYTVFSASRMLQDLLYGKHVKITLNVVDEEEEYRVPEAEFDKTAAQMLQSCKLLRCESIAFEVQDFAVSENAQLNCVEKVEDLTAIITGTRYTRDTYSAWVSTKKLLCEFLRAEELGDLEEDYDESLTAMMQAAMDYDEAACKDKIQGLLSKLKDDVTEDFEIMIASCESEEDAEELREALPAKIIRIEECFVTGPEV